MLQHHTDYTCCSLQWISLRDNLACCDRVQKEGIIQQEVENTRCNIKQSFKSCAKKRVLKKKNSTCNLLFFFIHYYAWISKWFLAKNCKDIVLYSKSECFKINSNYQQSWIFWKFAAFLRSFDSLKIEGFSI